MRRGLRFGFAAVVAGVVAVLALAGPASARKYQMSGDWVRRNGNVFIPLQFAGTAMGTGGQMTAISMGNLTSAFFFPNGPVSGLGGVTATGSAPASLMVPPHRFVQDAMAAVPGSALTFVQITTNFGIDNPYQAATLAPGGGPGSFTWCPTDPLCVDGAGTMLASDPPLGMGTRNGRVIYKSGANQFGGVMQMGLRRGGIVSFVFNTAPNMQIGHAAFGGSGATLQLQVVGGGMADVPATSINYLGAGFVTQPLSFMLGNLITQPGPKVTTMFGLTNTMAGPTLYLPIGTTTMGAKFGQLTSNYGFPHTTGTVIAQQTGNGSTDTFFTFMGYDKRTALGAGAIQTVAGGLSFRTTGIGTAPYANLNRVRMTLGAPIPSMSPSGIAAAGALMLLATGYALRRRIR
jgi:hypothetical protein